MCGSVKQCGCNVLFHASRYTPELRFRKLAMLTPTLYGHPTLLGWPLSECTNGLDEVFMKGKKILQEI